MSRIILAALLSLASCGPSVVIMRNPSTGELIQCRGANTGLNEFAELRAAHACADGYQAAGWARMN